ARDLVATLRGSATTEGERAEAELLGCRIELDTHELPAAIAACERAWLAAEAAGADLVAIDALITGAAAHTALDHPREAMRLVELAGAKLRAVGAPAELRLRLDGERTAAQGRIDPGSAVALAEHDVAAVERELGPDSTRLLLPLNRWAVQARDSGDLATAREIHGRALALAERRLGPMHPRVAAVLNNLGANEWAAGNHVLALALLERSLAIKRMSPGWSTTRTATGWANLADVHMALGDHTTAIVHARRALDVRLHAFGEHATAVADSRQILARALRLAGAHDEAMAEAERALAAVDASEPSGLADEMWLELAWNELDAGRTAAARAGFVEVIDAHDGVDVAELASAWLGLVLTNAADGAWADADDAWAEVTRVLADFPGDPLIGADAALRYARALAAFDPARAHELREHARATYLRHAPFHPALVRIALEAAT
ncbi:MAG TPA: tetratricopeptide repeat protein, partial [Nannocystaceae bacterium]|nr:tetratricopeptide repeat protein [Nannocystaceae bacterium]